MAKQPHELGELRQWISMEVNGLICPGAAVQRLATALERIEPRSIYVEELRIAARRIYADACSNTKALAEDEDDVADG